MKKLLLSLALLFFAVPALAELPASAPSAAPKAVQSEFVCMVNDTAFDKPQIAVKVDGKIYYGCCEMCKGRLATEASVRTAKDPVSGKDVDKATAVIGRMPDDTVRYFESVANMQKFSGQ